MSKKSQLDRSIDKLEKEIAFLKAVHARLVEDRAAQGGRTAAKPRRARSQPTLVEAP